MNRTHLLGAFSAGAFLLASMNSHAVAIPGQGTWETTLQGRDLDGNLSTFEAYYDTALDITWLVSSSNTGMTWAASNAWAAGLNFNGVTGWRLPVVAPINGTNFNLTFSNNATTDWGFADNDGWVDGLGNPVSELGHMYYVTLGNLGQCTPNDTSPSTCVAQPFGPSNMGPFSISGTTHFWTGTTDPTDPSTAFDFNFNNGSPTLQSKNNPNLPAWAVHSGDVGLTVVPIPTAVLLFGSGLLGLIGIARRKKA